MSPELVSPQRFPSRLILLLVLSVGGCSDRPEEPPRVQRLFAEAPPPTTSEEAGVQALISDSFDDASSWLSPASRGKTATDEDAVHGETVLSFEKPVGAAFRQVEVEGGRWYRVSVFVRGRIERSGVGHAVVTPREEIVEGAPTQVLKTLLSEDRDRVELKPRGSYGDWTELDALVRAAPNQRVLTIALVAGIKADLHGDAVAFDLLSIFGSTMQEVVERQVTRREGRPPRLTLGGVEDRWVSPLFVGQELSTALTIPSISPILSFSLASLGGTQEAQVRVEWLMGVEGDELSSLKAVTLPIHRSLEGTTWRDEDVDLSAWAGKRVQVAVRATSDRGDGVVFLGSPMIVGGHESPRPPDVLLVSLDTLRADRVSAYGYGRETTPILDAIASKGVKVLRTYSTSSWTLPSHASMFTGQYPDTHGLNQRDRSFHPRLHPTLAERLAQEGYVTLGITAGGFVDQAFGFSSGFDLYTNDDPLCEGTRPSPDTERALEVIERVRKLSDAPVFVFLHTYGCHDYNPAAQDMEALGLAPQTIDIDRFKALWTRERFEGRVLKEEERILLSDLYDGTVRGTDRALGAFLERWDSVRNPESTLLMITSDHGEEFDEHGDLFHQNNLHDESVRVPWILRGPGIAQGRILEGPANLVDVTPSLLALLGLEDDPRMEGFDLSSSFLSTERSPGLPSRGDMTALIDIPRCEVESLTSGHYRIIRTTDRSAEEIQSTSALFHLETDPAEKVDLGPERPQVLASLRRELEKRRTQQRDWRISLLGESADEEGALSPELRARLRQLGYFDE